MSAAIKAGFSFRNPITNSDLLIAAGIYDGIFSINKHGTNEVVGTTFEDIWLPSGVLVHIPVATTLEIASSDANDTILGTGARQILIQGYDADFNNIEEIVDLDGQTPVLTTKLFFGIDRAWVETAGSGSMNAGDVYLADDSTSWASGVPATAAAIQAKIGIGYGQTQLAIYTVPAGHSAYITGLFVTAVSGKTVTWRLIGHHRVENSFRTHLQGTTTTESPTVIKFSPYIRITEKTTIHMRGKVNATTAAVSMGFDMILVDETII